MFRLVHLRHGASVDSRDVQELVLQDRIDTRALAAHLRRGGHTQVSQISFERVSVLLSMHYALRDSFFANKNYK